MTYALRELYGIEGGKGRIWNLDESMTYKVERNEKCGASSLIFLFFIIELHVPKETKVNGSRNPPPSNLRKFEEGGGFLEC